MSKPAWELLRNHEGAWQVPGRWASTPYATASVIKKPWGYQLGGPAFWGLFLLLVALPSFS